MQNAVNDGETELNETRSVGRCRGLNAIVIVIAVLYVNICFACEVALYAALICALCVGRVVRLPCAKTKQ